MQIALDGRGATWYRGSGIGTYTFRLLENLGRDVLNEYIVFDGDSWKPLEHARDFEGKEKRRDFWKAVTQGSKPPDGVDVIHNPHNGIGALEMCTRNTRLVVTIHDLIPFTMPQTCSPMYLRLAHEQALKVAQRADFIITVSNHSKQDIVKFLDVTPEKIAVIYEAPEEIYFPADKGAAADYIRKQYGIDGPYFLNVGGFSPRKNLGMLIQAFARFCQKDNDYRLVILGRAGGGSYDNCQQAVEMLGIEDRVVFPGFAPTNDLPHFYNAAEAFVYPSLYEGFGLPPLEAMACRVPTIAADATSLPEVLQAGALYVSPYAVDDMADAMYAFGQSAAMRRSWGEKGYRQARKFSWARMGLETRLVYEAVVEER